MSRRLQVVMDEAELERYRRRAAQHGITLSEWVRRALEQALEAEAAADPDERLRALDRALACGHPTADIDDMLAEIEEGRGGLH